MAMKERVTCCECWARDGLQSMPVWVPTEKKLEMIGRFVDAGFKKMEVTSFSHPKLLPQFKDAVEVLQGLPRTGKGADVSYVVLMPNEKGFSRFEQCVKEGYGASEIILMISSSETHNLKNFRMTHDEAMASHARIIEGAHALGVKIIGCAGTVWGCPIAGDVPLSDVEKLVRFYIDHGAQTIMLGDTTGVANPVSVRRVISHMQAVFPGAEFISHFHDTRGTGLLNSITALELGLNYVDSSVGAIGGQPASGASKYHLGFTGNTCTEDLVAVLGEMGTGTGVDIMKLIAAGKRAEEILDQRLRSNVIRCGPVSHQASSADKGPGAEIVA